MQKDFSKALQIRGFLVGATLGLILFLVAGFLPQLGPGSLSFLGISALGPLFFVVWDGYRTIRFLKNGHPRPLPNQWRWVAVFIIGSALIYLVNQVEYASTAIFQEGADLVLVKAYFGAKLHLLFTVSFFWAFINPDKEWERRVMDSIRV